MKQKISFSIVLSFLGLSLVASATEIILTPTSKTNMSAKATPETLTYENIFTRTLTLGSSGQDVMAAKKIISLEFNTTLETGATFTINTANAIRKFQEKYAIEILIPNGLSAGTGVIGPSTRIKLNQLAANYKIKLADFTVPIIITDKSILKTTLRLGSVGDEVSILKIILNSDKDTKITTSSLGITNIFDLNTETAVNKFQEKYASEILTPLKLTNGTGVVGAATRKKLNFILLSILKNFSTTTTDGSPSLTVPLDGSLNYQSNTSDNSDVTSINAGANTNTAPSSGEIVSQTCDGTTLVVTKTGFNSTYDIKTPNSSRCPGRTIYPIPNDNLYTPGVDDTYTPGNNTYTPNVITPASNTNPYIPNTYTYPPSATTDKTKKEIKTFDFPPSSKTLTTINEGDETINVDVPPLFTYRVIELPILSGTMTYVTKVNAPAYDLTSIAPIITFDGASISPSSGIAQDFSKPVTYTVTALDGSTKQYAVTAAPVKCVDYYSKGVDVGGLVTKVKKVHIVGTWASLVPGLQTDPYLVWANLEENTGNPVIKQYCGAAPAIKFISPYVKPEVGSYFIGTIGSKFQKINTCPSGTNDQVGGCYETDRVIEVSSF